MIQLDNFPTDEVSEVYQRCVLVSGKCNTASALEQNDGHVLVETGDGFGKTLFPEQRWPMCHGNFKALLLLSPGLNKITITTQDDASTELSIRYIPLLQTPPLHLAILVAKDSPLLMDCPPAKFGGISSAHSDLSAAIAKFRMTAYMWQALTAEDLRAKGLGRRAFRLEEEWSTDTLSQRSQQTPTAAAGTVPKIHLIRTDKTVAQLRDANLAQQNPHARHPDDLHKIFTAALLAHGAPFTTHTRPVVAGLILDSHYNTPDTTISPTSPHHSPLILAHAALGSHDPRGLSLGIFGSHLTYAWPRFLDEVPACLLDPTPPGDTVGNDNGECDSMWRACAVGQGAFLHEVGHALGAPHSEGIMLRGYSPDWVRVFLGGVRSEGGEGAGKGGLRAVGEGEGHDCRWALSDALKFRMLRQFWLPGDGEVSKEAPSVEIEVGEDPEELKSMSVHVNCEAGIARVVFSPLGKADEEEDKVSVSNPLKSLRYSYEELASRFGTKGLRLKVTGMNGKEYSVDNIWKLFQRGTTSILVPGTKIRLLKQCVSGDRLKDGDEETWDWAVMLKKRDKKGNLVAASKIDLRVGCSLDGAEVYYQDGTKIPCGPRGKNGQDPSMGGHQARKLVLPRDVEISKVAVTREGGWWLGGLRMWLSNGKAMGALNYRRDESTVDTLVPARGHKIIGFYGVSGTWGMCISFGIVTAPRDADLPDSVYDMQELQNNPDRDQHRSKKRRVSNEEDDDEQMSDPDECDEDIDDSSNSGDKDEGYDDGWDSEVERVYRG